MNTRRLSLYALAAALWLLPNVTAQSSAAVPTIVFARANGYGFQHAPDQHS